MVTDEELYAQGFKRYNYHIGDSTGYLTDGGGRFASRLAGTIEVPTTGNHKIRFNVINNGDKTLWLDMIHIVPFENDQMWPRYDVSPSDPNEDGQLKDKPDWYPVPAEGK